MSGRLRLFGLGSVAVSLIGYRLLDYHYVPLMRLDDKEHIPISVPITASNTLDYSMYQQILSEYVIDGKVEYTKLRKSMMREKQKDSLFIKWLNIISKTGPNTEPTLFADDNEKLKFYMNAYNALTMYGVLYHSFNYHQSNHMLLSSVMDIKSRLNVVNGFGFFESAMYKLDNNGKMTLNRLENKILRKEFDDARIHCAINCASIGCPKLQSFVIEVEHLDTLCSDFVNNPKHVLIDNENNKIALSKIFKWYKQDFEQFYDAQYIEGRHKQKFEKHKILSFVWHYGNDEIKQKLDALTSGNFEIEWIPYDWNLNDAKKISAV